MLSGSSEMYIKKKKKMSKGKEILSWGQKEGGRKWCNEMKSACKEPEKQTHISKCCGIHRAQTRQWVYLQVSCVCVGVGGWG